MSQRYLVEQISIGKRDALFEEYKDRFLYEKKANIYGICIKLITDDVFIKDMWEENFFTMSENIRSHGRLLVTRDENKTLHVLYDEQSRTAILINIDYYGWVKSLALSVAGDVLEDDHQIYSVHGACVDLNGQGICLIAPPDTGKTTHTYGLLRLEDARAVSDDWFFVRLYEGEDAVAFGSEKNFYIRADIAKIWDEYKKLLKGVKFDNKGRAVVNVRWVVGKGNIRPLVTLNKTIILKRDPGDPKIAQKMSGKDAVEYIMGHNYCNPHWLVVSDYKNQIRKAFFSKLFDLTDVYIVNTVESPLEVHEEIKKIAKSP